jgi:hypothetical protein
MNAHQAIVAGSAYFAGFLTVLLWMRSKITQNLGDQAPDENGTAGAGGADFIHHGEGQ